MSVETEKGREAAEGGAERWLRLNSDGKRKTIMIEERKYGDQQRCELRREGRQWKGDRVREGREHGGSTSLFVMLHKALWLLAE